MELIKIIAAVVVFVCFVSALLPSIYAQAPIVLAATADEGQPAPPPNPYPNSLTPRSMAQLRAAQKKIPPSILAQLSSKETNVTKFSLINELETGTIYANVGCAHRMPSHTEQTRMKGVIANYWSGPVRFYQADITRVL
jgi:hypothetical protein